MYENIRKAIAEHEAETLKEFATEIKTKTAADILESWYYKQYTTPATLRAIQEAEQGEPLATVLIEKMTAKKAREEKKNTQKRLEKIEAAEAAHLPENVNISVEFSSSRTWGYIPHAIVTGYQRRTMAKASGCGYDKESAAIAYAFNDNPEVMKILYNHAEQGEKFPYSVHTFAGVPCFDGGCGVSCFYSVFDACGYEFKQVASGHTFNAYTLRKKA